MLVLGVGTLGGIVLTLEPAGPAVALALVAIGVVVASVASLVLLRWTVAGRSARARSSRARAVRRGVEVGAVVGLIAALQVVGGLTPLTAVFVILSFAVAEYVLSAGASPAR
jgi:hypothetical protein